MDNAYFAILAWVPLAAGFFAVLRPARALVSAYLLAWLFLPMARIPIQGFWDVDKVLACNVGVLLGVLLFCPGRLRSYRPGAPDFFLLAFAGGACVTSVMNGLGLHDGVSSLTHKVLYYAVPFWLGRAVVRDRRDFLEAGRLIAYGAALYAVLAVWEWRMSPQIHKTLYGFFQHGWIQHFRWGFYRPIVCFPHALGLGMFFAWTSLLSLGLLRAGHLRPVLGIPPIAIAALPLLGLLTSMSLGPWGLFLVGIGLLVWWSQTRRRRVVWIPVVFALVWMAGRYTGMTRGQWLVSAAASVSPQRAGSLQYRVDAETLLLERAKQRPIFGWGGWGRNRARDERGRDLVATDGLWIIFVGSYGLVGLACFYLWWCWPLLMSRRSSRDLERDPMLMPLLIAIGLQAVNLLFNGFLSPVLILMSGAVVTAMIQVNPTVQGAARPAPTRAGLLLGLQPGKYAP